MYFVVVTLHMVLLASVSMVDIANADGWKTYNNEETIDSCVAGKGMNSSVNGVFYLGDTDSWEECMYICGNDTTCISFDYHQSVASSGTFAKACYKRTTDNFEPNARQGRVVGLRPGAKPGTAPACIKPPAPGPPPPPSKPNVIDCAFRHLGMTVADRNLGGDTALLAYVADGLQLSNCPDGSSDRILRQEQDKISLLAFSAPSRRLAADATTVYVSATTGSDSNDGTQASPFKTLNRAQQSVGAGVRTVMVAPGTYYESLVFTPRDSGTSTQPVTWQASDPTQRTVISGGTPVSCEWKPVAMNGITAQVCDVGKELNGIAQSLFINGTRVQRARYPNGVRTEGASLVTVHYMGDPLVPNSGFLSAGMGTCPQSSYPAFASPMNVQVKNEKTGTLLSQGWAHPVSKNTTVLVLDASVSHDMGAFTNYRAFVNGSNSCYNTSLNLPYWEACTCACKNFTTGQLGARPSSWKTPSTGIIRMFHTSGWGGWMFHVDDYDAATSTIAMTGGQQTGQSGTCAINGNRMYVENILEELDDTNEFFLDEGAGLLYYVPPDGVTSMAGTDVVATKERRVVQFRGANDTSFVEHITFSGFIFTHSEPTFLDDYEMPSGGDWTLHRGGMVFLDGSEHITIENCTFDQAGGNALFLSQHAWYTTVHANSFLYTGESAVALVGSTDLMNGTKNTYVAYSNITNNLMYEVGYYGKQTAAVFKSICYRTNIINNVAANGPRSGFNFNDAFMGGDVMQGNLLMGYVRETADHASFNSWDRQSWFFNIDGVVRFQPENTRITRNLILNKDFVYGSLNSDWCIDHDDASSFYYDDHNVMVWGSHKWRDGVNKSYVSNLYVTPPDAGAAQQWGVGWYTGNTARSSFLNNTFVNWGSQRQFGFTWSIPSPSADFNVDYNTYYTPNDTQTPFNIAHSKSTHTLQQWQQSCDCDAHATISADMDLDRTLALALEYLEL